MKNIKRLILLALLVFFVGADFSLAQCGNGQGGGTSGGGGPTPQPTPPTNPPPTPDPKSGDPVVAYSGVKNLFSIVAFFKI